MAKHTNLKSLFTDIANAIREKTGITDIIIADDFPDAIRNISSGGGITSSDVTAAKAQVLKGYTTITNDSNDEVVEGAMLDNGAMNKTMDGINTKNVTIPSGYTSGGTVSLTDDIDNEVDAQADLISQIMTTLEGKTAAEGGNANVNMNTCTVNITTDYGWNTIFYEDVINDVITYNIKGDSTTYTLNVRCDSVLYVYQNGYYNSTIDSGEILASLSSSGAIYKIPSNANTIVNINIETD